MEAAFLSWKKLLHSHSNCYSDTELRFCDAIFHMLKFFCLLQELIHLLFSFSLALV